MTSRLTEGKSWEGKGDGDPGRDLGVAQEEVGPALLQPSPPSFPCPAFSSLAVMEDSFSEWVFNSESFKEDYVLLLFLPMDGITWTRLSWRHSAWSLTSLQVLAARWKI